MALIKKYSLWGIFISVLAIFAMSHNANAITPVIDLNEYSLLRATGTLNLDCVVLNGANVQTGSNLCGATISGNTSIKSIYSQSAYNFKAGDILNFYFIVYSEYNNFEYIPKFNAIPNQNGGFLVLDISEVTSDIIRGDSASYNGYINPAPNNDFGFDLNNYSGFVKIYNITLRAVSDGNYKYGLETSGGFFTFNSNDVGGKFYFTIRNFVTYRYVGSPANKEQEEKTQEAVDESQSAGSSSSSSASQGGANLLTAITGFFNVITSAQPTNCRFNAPLNTYFGNQRLNVDLCSLDLPSGIGALTSIIAIGILIPFAIHMFNKFIALFRSFQS